VAFTRSARPSHFVVVRAESTEASDPTRGYGTFAAPSDEALSAVPVEPNLQPVATI